MRKNKTKAKLRANQCAIGAGIAFPSPDLVELCAVVGFDFVTFDTEHEPMGSELRLAYSAKRDLSRAAAAFLDAVKAS